jgi:hypothetical protein
MCRLEQDIGKKLCDKSFAYAGTSTGSIIAAGLAEGKSAHELFALYSDNLKKIFTKYPAYKRVLPKCPIYDNSNLKKLLKENFKGKMGDWKKPIYIPVTCMNGDSEEKVWDLGDKDVDKWFAVLTSCAAPTYFDVIEKDGKSFCDGGMWGNDPVMTLQSGLNKSGHSGYKILTFNTGMDTPNTAKGNMTLLDWAKYIFKHWVARSGKANYYEACANIGKENVFRASPSYKKEIKMDDISTDTINKVVDIWNKYYDSVRNDILAFIR